MNNFWRLQAANRVDLDVVAVADEVAHRSARSAEALDQDGAFPTEAIADLYRAGLLLAPFPQELGGVGLGFDSEKALVLQDVLITLGRGSLALGRLYEGHVNAVKLIRLYGTLANLRLLHDEACQGRLTGVWMAEDDIPLYLETHGSKRRLRGRKVFASGAGFIQRPLVAAKYSETSLMMLPLVSEPARADINSWTALGMKATATGTVDFTDIEISGDEIVGNPGDYMRSPFFRGGAWRVLAVQLGGLQNIIDLFRAALAASPHAEAPLQLARLSEAIIAAETARLWVHNACLIAETQNEGPERIDAYVDLARNAFEMAALNVVRLAQKAIGLRAYLRPSPLERVIRDLTTYLRQPVLDLSLLSAGKFYLGRDEAAGPFGAGGPF